jgi:hypothetical protein
MNAGRSGANRKPVCESHSRIAELAEILAAGLIRLKARQSTQISSAAENYSLDCAGHQSGHADRLTSDGGLD